MSADEAVRFDAQRLRDWAFEPIRHRYTKRDTMLYALSLGAGCDPSDAQALRFCYELDLQALPTMAVVLAYPGFWAKDPATGIDWVKLVHGEQHLMLHQNLPVEGEVLGHSRVTHVIDKGEGKGALMISERKLCDAQSGALLATMTQTTFMRGDGGFQARGQHSDDAPAARVAVPDRAPDLSHRLQTRPESALLYRLMGDDNPLHADPAVAIAAGFKQPILHGLASFGVAARSLIASCADHDASRLVEIGLRFSSPVYPGETLETAIWKLQEPGELAFQTKVLERDRIVLSHGTARIRS
ncbi:MAG: 3-alpha,7-alpha,12-alpha-trihydroxy-5-beta-cholest-24-enoyl-CoA hydratase [Betaproteobacteria bacterium]|nr:3-alpha,7-alpha,12-alpha-trihydroxy-5-beta-cholest-24-enoyl-CoA hydratase [Betaproteobacteria bacterium]NDA30874.1 3-alpha,7-alpha,12-alpha-trihydroxy-5-beta-cholest-24-enoyl-CoA hydratase [Betaproteobacteria bacterium]NDC67477.1 3-alpha,7-alpha,12-alpha-trihydroxy-5-beta-cholest-24-enoyl-CoA hydratase [Betaproteobacteria bacterium]NDF76225.1 3-alpha,7-alpha,12-alpha-trihydroxy-5-beta-cholest-24-enoyl-CoA hydratase [Betaproteobacteria bacterium]NDH35782.1 3-alpha,7-alpha,12-alpha-trihydroxy-